MASRWGARNVSILTAEINIPKTLYSINIVSTIIRDKL